jgi:hypothetical protein
MRAVSFIPPDDDAPPEEDFLAGVCALCGLVVTEDDPAPCDGIGCVDAGLT